MEAYVRFGTQGNMFLTNTSGKLINKAGNVFSKSTYLTKKMMARTGVPQVLKSQVGKEVDVFFNPNFLNGEKWMKAYGNFNTFMKLKP